MSRTRAFVGMHGVTPSEAHTLGVKLKAYPRITFQISIKGVVEIGRAGDYEIEVYPPGNPASEDYICEIWIPIAKVK